MNKNAFPYEPTLMKRATLHWNAHQRWTWKFLSSLDGTKFDLFDRRGVFRERSSADRYIEALLRQHDPLSRLYVSGWRFFEHYACMLNDFIEPAQAQPDAFRLFPTSVFNPLLWIIIGSSGSGTDLHRDVLDTHAWLAVIRGRKRVVLHPPVHIYNYRKYRAEGLNLLRKRCGEGAWRYVEVDDGDLLLIPAGWWHEVRNEGITLAVTRNFVTPDIHNRVSLALNAEGLDGLRDRLDQLLQAG